MTYPPLLRQPFAALLFTAVVGASALLQGCVAPYRRLACLYPEEMAQRNDLPTPATEDAQLNALASGVVERGYKEVLDYNRDQAAKGRSLPENVVPKDNPEVLKVMIMSPDWRMFREPDGAAAYRRLSVAVALRHQGRCMVIFDFVQENCASPIPGSGECATWGAAHLEDYALVDRDWDKVVACDKVH